MKIETTYNLGVLPQFHGVESDPAVLSLYGQAYFDAALRLAKPLLEKYDAGFDAMPVVFLLRHATELSLKSMVMAIRQARSLLRETEIENVDKPMKGHDLRPLLRFIQKHLPTYIADGLPQPYVEMIETMHELDKTSFEFRYATNKEGKRLASLVPEGEFSFSALIECAEKARTAMWSGVFAILGPAEDEAERRSDWEAEMRADMSWNR